MEAVFEVRVKKGNRIEIDVNDQIAELDLYLCDKLIDMTTPVTVASGQDILYQGQPKSKLTVKLRPSPDYDRDGGDTLWQDLIEIHGKVHGQVKGQATSAPTERPNGESL